MSNYHLRKSCFGVLSILRSKLKNFPMIAQLITLEPTVASRGGWRGHGVGQGWRRGAGQVGGQGGMAGGWGRVVGQRG
jgi:hypothetical protein